MAKLYVKGLETLMRGSTFFESPRKNGKCSITGLYAASLVFPGLTRQYVEAAEKAERQTLRENLQEIEREHQMMQDLIPYKPASPGHGEMRCKIVLVGKADYYAMSVGRYNARERGLGATEGLWSGMEITDKNKSRRPDWDAAFDRCIRIDDLPVAELGVADMVQDLIGADLYEVIPVFNKTEKTSGDMGEKQKLPAPIIPNGGDIIIGGVGAQLGNAFGELQGALEEVNVELKKFGEAYGNADISEEEDEEDESSFDDIENNHRETIEVRGPYAFSPVYEYDVTYDVLQSILIRLSEFPGVLAKMTTGCTVFEIRAANETEDRLRLLGKIERAIEELMPRSDGLVRLEIGTDDCCTPEYRLVTPEALEVIKDYPGLSQFLMRDWTAVITTDSGEPHRQLVEWIDRYIK